MGCRELIESLRTAGDAKITALRAKADEEAERIRTDAARRIEELRADHARTRAAEAARHTEALLSGARLEARRMDLRAERALAERIFRLARRSLRSLRNVGYRDVFASFVRELPQCDWKTVRVNPEDRDLARELLPGAGIVEEPGISGGLEAVSEGDRVRVVNTFEKRLEHLWEEMLPEIMRDVRRLMDEESGPVSKRQSGIAERA